MRPSAASIKTAEAARRMGLCATIPVAIPTEIQTSQDMRVPSNTEMTQITHSVSAARIIEGSSMRPTRADPTPGFVTHQPSRVRSPDRESCLHCRVKQAPIRILAWLAGHVSPRCARFDAMGIEGLVIRRRRVWKQILVDPQDPIPPLDRQHIRSEAQVLDGHDMRIRRGARWRPYRYGTPGEQCADEDDCVRSRHEGWVPDSGEQTHSSLLPRDSCSCFACSRWSTNAGRTFTSSALSSS